jgi:hypothetical protein
MLNFSQVIPKVSYTLKVADATVASWETHPLSHDNVENAVTEDFGSDLELWTNLTNTLKELYLEGNARINYGKKVEVVNAVVKAYSSANNGIHNKLILRVTEQCKFNSKISSVQAPGHIRELSVKLSEVWLFF